MQRITQLGERPNQHEAVGITGIADPGEVFPRYRVLAGQWRALVEALLPDAVEPLGRNASSEST